MEIYFDTNIYNFIRSRNELHSTYNLLKSYGCKLTASAGNLFETFAITSSEDACAELEVIVHLANSFEKKPQSWLHAMELKRELQRRRPSWLKKVPFTKRIQKFLRFHSQLWDKARQMDLPAASSYRIYQRDAERGISEQRHFQKVVRGQRVRKRYDFTLLSPSGEKKTIDTSDPEIFWRVEGLMVWYNAIELRSPASRDYADWLSSYLKPGAFRDSCSYQNLWINEVSAETMKLNRLTGLVSFYQLNHKVSHGNPADQLHAGHWINSDLFVTADVAFYKVLTSIARNHFKDRPEPALIDRSGESCVDQIETLIRKYMV